MLGGLKTVLGVGTKEGQELRDFLWVLIPSAGRPQLILRTGETGPLVLVLTFGESKIRLFLIKSYAMHTSGPANAAQIGLIRPRLF